MTEDIAELVRQRDMLIHRIREMQEARRREWSAVLDDIDARLMNAYGGSLIATSRKNVARRSLFGGKVTVDLAYPEGDTLSPSVRIFWAGSSAEFMAEPPHLEVAVSLVAALCGNLPDGPAQGACRS